MTSGCLLQLERRMESISSSCFICGVNVVTDDSPLLMKRCDSFRNLRELVFCLCELLSVEVTPEDWEGVDGDYLMKQTIACDKCFEILRNVERVHELILKTQRELKFYLEEVESLIIRSESSSLHHSFWTTSCFKLRQSIVNGRTRASNQDNVDLGCSLGTTGVKKEILERIDPLTEDLQCSSRSFDIRHDITKRIEIPVTNNLTPVSIQNSFKEPPEFCGGSIAAGETSFPVITTDHEGVPRSRKRRKVIIIAEEDLEDERGQIGGLPSSDAVRARKAKQSAGQAIRQSELIPNTEDDDWICGDDNDDDLSYEDTSKDPVPQSEEEENDKEEIPTSNKKLQSDQKLKEPAWWSFVIAEDNLYLYHLDTFVRRTFTSLQCQAYKCNFQAEGNDFTSFQLMREHLEQNHRSRKHRQKTPHPCLLCNTLHENREDFNAHLNSSHREKLGHRVTTYSVCECCSRVLRTKLIRRHLFTHKNASEKAAAYATGWTPIHVKRKLEGTQPKKLWPCTFENCTKVYNTDKGLYRHRHTHLPKELRTDLALCPECGKEILKEHLSYHMKAIHHPELVDRSLICRYCDKRFLPQHRSFLEAHIRRHKGETPYLCNECGTSFFCMGSLQMHQKTVHETSDPIPCQWCDAVYTKRRSFWSHMKSKHPEKWEPERNSTKSMFYAKKKVNKEELYGPVQEFPCPECEAIYKFRSTLKKHMEEKHGMRDGYNMTSKPKKPRNCYRQNPGKFEGGV